MESQQINTQIHPESLASLKDSYINSVTSNILLFRNRYSDRLNLLIYIFEAESVEELSQPNSEYNTRFIELVDEFERIKDPLYRMIEPLQEYIDIQEIKSLLEEYESNKELILEILASTEIEIDLNKFDELASNYKMLIDLIHDYRDLISSKSVIDLLKEEGIDIRLDIDELLKKEVA